MRVLRLAVQILASTTRPSEIQFVPCWLLQLCFFSLPELGVGLFEDALNMEKRKLPSGALSRLFFTLSPLLFSCYLL
jgi:hypothetical protein